MQILSDEDKKWLAKNSPSTLSEADRFVSLSEEEFNKIIEIAKQWRTVSDNSYQIKWKQERKKTLEDTIIGVAYEMAVAKFLDIPYDGDIGRAGLFDVGGKYEVRGTKYKNGCLLLHPEDKEAPYILVVGEDKEYEIIGWILGSEGKKQEFWRTDVRYPCFFVPQSELNDILSLNHFTA